MIVVFFNFEVIWFWDVFLCFKKDFFFENKNNYVYDIVLILNWIFCYKYMNR